MLHCRLPHCPGLASSVDRAETASFKLPLTMHPHSGGPLTLPPTPCVCSLANLAVSKALTADTITARLITATSALASKGNLAVSRRTTLRDVIIGSSSAPAQLNATAAVNIIGPTTITGGLLPDVITARLITATQALASRNTLAVSKLSNLAGGVSAGATTLASLIVSRARQL